MEHSIAYIASSCKPTPGLLQIYILYSLRRLGGQRSTFKFMILTKKMFSLTCVRTKRFAKLNVILVALGWPLAFVSNRL